MLNNNCILCVIGRNCSTIDIGGIFTFVWPFLCISPFFSQHKWHLSLLFHHKMSHIYYHTISTKEEEKKEITNLFHKKIQQFQRSCAKKFISIFLSVGVCTLYLIYICLKYFINSFKWVKCVQWNHFHSLNSNIEWLGLKTKTPRIYV